MSEPITINCCRTLSYNCIKCKISFKTSSELINHVHQKHIVYECTCCAYSTPKYESLIMHSRDKHNKYDLLHCPRCHFIGIDLASLDKHYIESHVYPSHTYYCSTCGYDTIFESDMRIHLCGNHKSNLKFCPCSVAPRSNCEKPINVYSHNCSYCNFQTNARQKLTNHFMDIHWPGYESSDESANESSDEYSDDDNSVYYNHNNYNNSSYDEDESTCFICDKELVYGDKKEMMEHLRRHDTSINCLFCKKLPNL